MRKCPKPKHLVPGELMPKRLKIWWVSIKVRKLSWKINKSVNTTYGAVNNLMAQISVVFMILLCNSKESNRWEKISNRPLIPNTHLLSSTRIKVAIAEEKLLEMKMILLQEDRENNVKSLNQSNQPMKLSKRKFSSLILSNLKTVAPAHQINNQ